MKKFVLTLVLATSFFGIFSCCDEYIPFYEIVGLETTILDTDFNVLSEEVTADSLFLEVMVIQNYIANNGSWNLINKGYALQPCPEDGEDGLKDDIRDYKIYSSVEFLGYLPGEDLSPLMMDSLYLNDFNNWNLKSFRLSLFEKQEGFLDLNIYFKYESEREDTFHLISFDWM